MSHNGTLLLAASVLSHAPSESESRLRQGLRLEQKKETSGAPQRPLVSRGLNYDSDFDEGEGREKVRCDRARRFGRGPASVLCSWEVVKAEVQFSVKSIPLPKWIFPPEAETKKSFPESASFPPRIRPFTPILPACLSDHCLLSISLLTPWGANLPCAWHPHLHRRQNQLESRSGLVYKTGKALESGSGPPYYCGFQICVLMPMQSETCTCHMLRTQRTAPMSLVIVAIAGELNILVKATVTTPVPRAERPRAPPIRPASYGCSTTNAQCTRRRQKPEVKVDELVKIPPFQLAIRVAVLFFCLFKGDLVYPRQFHETYPPPSLVMVILKV